MKSSPFLSIIALTRVALAADVHGSGAEGTVMGPVAFLWPADRPWSADSDNVAPCGSNAAISNRTEFPIGAMGSIELTIADEAYDVALRIAYGNNPSTQSDFQAIKSNISELEPGHQCYSVENTPSAVATGSNATLQLEYWANDSNKNESFFACADIKFIEASLFKTQIPCFNVTSSEFETPASASPTSTASDAAAAPISESLGSSGLSGGAKAGISVASIIGAAIVLGGIAFLVLRRRRLAKKDVEFVPVGEKNVAASIGSAETAQ